MDSSSYRLQRVSEENWTTWSTSPVLSVFSAGFGSRPRVLQSLQSEAVACWSLFSSSSTAVVHSLLVLNTVLKLQRWRLVAVRWRGVSRAELTRRFCFWHIQTYFTQADPVHRPLQGPGRVWGLIPEVQPHSGDTVSSPKVHWLWMVVPVHKASILDTRDPV